MVGVSPGRLSSDGGSTLFLVPAGGGGGFLVAAAGFLVDVVVVVAEIVGPMAISCCLFSLWICSAGDAAVDACCFPLSFTFSFLLRQVKNHTQMTSTRGREGGSRI